ncbi:YgaP family membrane protein [Brevibacillus sp. TJ4]|uniref:YgaP family membrane protein n=1 Tax=Brevibacillus sp. TJ4 TaxID=3234853 RepID=UPI003B9E39E6
MGMRKNVGTTDAMIRMTVGILGLAYGVGQMSRRPHKTPWLLLGLSAMKVAEGATRFCPMYAALGLDSHSEKDRMRMMEKLKDAGMQAVKMAQMPMASKQKNAAQQHQSSSAESRPQKADSQAKLTDEDKLIEQSVREFVSMEEGETHGHTAYRNSEYRYPTYS